MIKLNLLLANLLDRALGLDENMSLGRDNTALGWEHPLPGWGWVLVILAAIASGLTASSRGEPPTRPA